MLQASNQSPSSQRPLDVLRRNQDLQSPASISVIIFITPKEEPALQEDLHLQDDGLPATAEDAATCLTVLSSQPAARADGPGMLYWEMGAQRWEMGAHTGKWEHSDGKWKHSAGKWEHSTGKGEHTYWGMGAQSTGEWEHSTGKWEHKVRGNGSTVVGNGRTQHWEMGAQSTGKWEHSTGKPQTWILSSSA
uniref:Uncharacterized protein n=1 Tax=Nomascus leucogenys TaxID=61853 RepID=A0A2I3G0F9_NOMLE